MELDEALARLAWKLRGRGFDANVENTGGNVRSVVVNVGGTEITMGADSVGSTLEADSPTCDPVAWNGENVVFGWQPGVTLGDADDDAAAAALIAYLLDYATPR